MTRRRGALHIVVVHLRTMGLLDPI